MIYIYFTGSDTYIRTVNGSHNINILTARLDSLNFNNLFAIQILDLIY